MEIGFTFVLVTFAGYVIGSIPSGYLVGRGTGIDVRTVGSGNIGATNVLRQLGRPLGYLVFAADVGKGVAAVLLSICFGRQLGESSAQYLQAAAAASCVVGHSFPIWLGFKGGKGVATSVGVLLVLMPLSLPVMIAIWFIVFRVTRMVSAASVAAAVSLPFAVVLLLHSELVKGSVLFYFSLAITALVVWSHRENLRRITSGEEPRFSRK